MKMYTMGCRDICNPIIATVKWTSYGVEVSTTLQTGLGLDQLLSRLMEDHVDYTVNFN